MRPVTQCTFALHDKVWALWCNRPVQGTRVQGLPLIAMMLAWLLVSSTLGSYGIVSLCM